LEEHVSRDVRQEELLSALSAFKGFFDTREFTHGKPPTALANPSPRTGEDASQGSSSAVSGKIRGMSGSMGTASTCLGFESGVRDFRGNVTVRPWNRQQAGWLRDIGFFPKH
jgi:hypothetical protein